MEQRFEDLVYEYMTRPPFRYKTQTQLKDALADRGYHYGKSAFHAYFNGTRTPPVKLVRELSELLALDPEEELALYRTLSVPAAA